MNTSITNFLSFDKGVAEMVRKNVTKGVVFFLFLALVLICAGLYFGVREFSMMDSLAATHTDHNLLTSELRGGALQLMLYGNLVMAGIGMLVITCLHLVRSAARIQQELDTLQKRNAQAEKLNEQLQALSHHQRLETIGRLTASISHEFNNLLTPIMGYSLMTLENLPPECEELQENLVEIYQSSRKAKEIISRLSDLSRKSTESSVREVSIDDLVRQTLIVVKPAQPENVELVLDLNCWDQRLRANEIGLSQMLLNLILNGFQAMEDGGTLTVGTTFDEKNIHILVQDTGCGIEKENLSRIFEPFFTTKDAGKGTGLGLAIAAQMVQNHNGTIQAESQVGKGTTFRIRLPR